MTGAETKWADEVMTNRHIVKGSQLVRGVEGIYQDGEDQGLSTGFMNLDNYYTVKTGELCIVTGVPSHGKSEFLDALVHNMAVNEGWKTLYFSPENQPYHRHAKKIVERYVGMGMREGRGEGLTRMPIDRLNEAMEWVDSHFSWIDIKSDTVSLDKILGLMAYSAETYGTKGFVVDPWNEIEHHRGTYSETEYISLALSTLRDFTRRYDVALWLVAHPAKMQRDRKTGEYPIPSGWDISGSANWRNKADVMLTVHRPSISEHLCDVHVLKVRFKSTGKPGSVRFRYNFANGRFTPAPFTE